MKPPDRVIVPRTVRPVEWDGHEDPLRRVGSPQTASGRGQPSSPKTLGDFRDERFIVLLGEPGSGKTTEFKAAQERDQNAECVEARAFLTAVRAFLLSDPDRRPEWKDKTLFIDGLDEARAGPGDPREPLDDILAGLAALRCPPARLACRSAAWLAINDLEAIRSEPGYEQPQILRLDPLTEQDIRTLLASGPYPDTNSFLDEARGRGLDGLLKNPLTLDLLAKAVAREGTWPESLAKTFEQACSQLVSEGNHEHAAATRFSPVAEPDILDAAGRISALFLLADQNGIAWDGTDVSEPDGVLLVSPLGGRHCDEMRRALDSRLFAATTPGIFVPAHAHVAEYLAARHLTQSIQDGALLSRVLTLVVLGDGIPSQLRGLAAWLAALCPSARRRLVDADPVAVVTYGDAAEFGEQDREHLLGRLAEQSNPYLWTFSADLLGGLVSPRTMDRLRDWTRGDDRSATTQGAMKLLLSGMAAVPQRCGREAARTDLLAVARDATWDSSVRSLALEVSVKRRNGPSLVKARGELLQDILAGNVSGPHDDLTTALISDLYPDHISPRDVWDYVGVPVDSELAHVLVDQSDSNDCRALLGALRNRSSKPGDGHDDSLTRLTWRVLEKALWENIDTVDAATWYDWIEMAAYDAHRRTWVAGRPNPDSAGVQSRLAERPTLQQNLILEFLSRNRGHAELAYEARDFCQLILRAGEPPRFEEWCLEQAREMSTAHEDAAHWLLQRAVASRRKARPSGDWLSEPLAFVAGCPMLEEALRDLAGHDKRVHERRLRYQTRRPEAPSLLAQVSKHKDALLRGEGPVALVKALGRAYFDHDAQPAPADSRSRLLHALANNEEATDVAMQALASVPLRDDDGCVADIMRLDRDRQFSGWGFPFLAGVDVMDRRGDKVPEVLGERVEMALWFYFTTSFPDDELPEWFARMLGSHAPLVAKVLADVHRNRFHGEADHLRRLGEDDRYQEVARLALPGLLKTFRAKGNLSQAYMLRAVLVAAIRHWPREVAARVRERVAVRRMNVAQRAVWLGAGVAVAPTEFVGEAVDFVASSAKGQQARMTHLVAVLHCIGESQERRLWRCATADAADVAALLRLLGPAHPPIWYGAAHKTGYIGARGEDWGADLAGHMISVLAQMPTPAAGRELDLLIDDPRLEAWHGELHGARVRQGVIQRDAEHAVPSIAEVEDVLNNGPPANAADLTALVVDRLTEIGRHAGHGAADDWQPYMAAATRDGGAELREPLKTESAFAAALLRALVATLPTGVRARLDTSRDKDERPVIQVIHRDHSVSVEITSSDDRNLWRLPRHQTLDRHPRDNKRSEYWIYLVLWFGWNNLKPPMPPPTGIPPTSPEELAHHLEEDLIHDARHQRQVVVIDARGLLADAAATHTHTTRRSRRMKNPRVFISYSWDNERHKKWVTALADRLRGDGIDLVYDKTHLKPGDRIPRFIQDNVRESDYILVICTCHYKQKADDKIGGVGYEDNIITGELYVRGDERKFIPILASGTWETALPTWAESKKGIDLRSEKHGDDEYDQLLAHLLSNEHAEPGNHDGITTSEEGTDKTLEDRTSTPIKIDRVLTDEITEPRRDGSPGSDLYTISFLLNRRPSQQWASIFVELWNNPPRYSTMHRPGIAYVVDKKIVLDGTTMEEVKEYHRETLNVCVTEANKRERTAFDVTTREEERRRARSGAHRRHMEELADGMFST